MKKYKWMLLAVISVLALACLVACGTKQESQKVEDTQNSTQNEVNDATKLPNNPNDGVLEDAVDGIGDGIKDTTDGVVDGAKEMTDGLVDGVKDVTDGVTKDGKDAKDKMTENTNKQGNNSTKNDARTNMNTRE